MTTHEARMASYAARRSCAGWLSWITEANADDLGDMLTELKVSWASVTETDPERVDAPTDMECELVRDYLRMRLRFRDIRVDHEQGQHRAFRVSGLRNVSDRYELVIDVAYRGDSVEGNGAKAVVLDGVVVPAVREALNSMGQVTLAAMPCDEYESH